MGVNIIERMEKKIELFRLEQRYTRRRHRRSAFVSNAIYVDGEYIYNSPSSTGSSRSSTQRPVSNLDQHIGASSKTVKRWLSVPGLSRLTGV